MDCSSPGSCVYGDSPGKNTRVGCYALLKEICPGQGSNPHLLTSSALAGSFFTTSATWEIPSFPFGNHKICFLNLWVCSYLVNKFTCIIFLDSTFKWCHTFVFLWLLLWSLVPSKPILVAANGKFRSFWDWVTFNWIYGPHLLYCLWWTPMLFPCQGRHCHKIHARVQMRCLEGCSAFWFQHSDPK